MTQQLKGMAKQHPLVTNCFPQAGQSRLQATQLRTKVTLLLTGDVIGHGPLYRQICPLVARASLTQSLAAFARH